MSQPRTPSFGDVTQLLQKNPEKVWVDSKEREYGLLQRNIDALHPNDEMWWIRLSRWTADEDFTAAAPRNDEVMDFPKEKDHLGLTNVGTGDTLDVIVQRFPDRFERGYRLIRIVFTVES